MSGVADLRAAIVAATTQAAGREGIVPGLDRPRQEGHGDYATNAAMILAGTVKRPPRDVAADLAEELRELLGPSLERVEIAGPGFINLFLTDDWYRRALVEMDDGRRPWGSGGATAPERVAADVSGLLRSLDSPDAAAVPISARGQAATEFAVAAARLRQAALRLQVAAAGLVDREKVHRLDAARTSRVWLERHSGITHREASELVRAAATCDRFPVVGEAFYNGELTLGHIDATGNIIPARFKGPKRDEAVEKVRAVQHVLVEAAKGATIEEYTHFCQRVRDKLDEDGPKDRSAEASRVWMHRLFNGRWSLSGGDA